MSGRSKRRRRRPDRRPRTAAPPDGRAAARAAARDARPRTAGGLGGRTAKGKPREERPRAPWHPVPLAELCVLVGIVLMVVGVIHGLGDDRGKLLLVFGMAMGSLGGLDTAAREHFSGWASHTSALAGVPAVVVAAVLFVAGVPTIAIAGAGVVVFAAAAMGFDRAWRRAAH
jgi:hypothetical protein